MKFIQDLAVSPEWQMAEKVVVSVLLLQFIDIIMGVLAAIYQKRMDSTIGWKGYTRKIATILVIAMVGIIDPLVPLPLTFGAACAYCAYECLSIVEKAGMMGVPIWPWLKDVLMKLRNFDPTAESKSLQRLESQAQEKDRQI